MDYTTEATTRAFARAAKTITGLDLTRDQVDAVMNVLRDVVAVVSIDVAESVSAILVENTRKALERKTQEGRVEG